MGAQQKCTVQLLGCVQGHAGKAAGHSCHLRRLLAAAAAAAQSGLSPAAPCDVRTHTWCPISTMELRRPSCAHISLMRSNAFLAITDSAGSEFCEEGRAWVGSRLVTGWAVEVSTPWKASTQPSSNRNLWDSHQHS